MYRNIMNFVYEDILFKNATSTIFKNYKFDMCFNGIFNEESEALVYSCNIHPTVLKKHLKITFSSKRIESKTIPCQNARNPGVFTSFHKTGRCCHQVGVQKRIW